MPVCEVNHDWSFRRSIRRVACLSASLPNELADALWTRPEELVAIGEPLRAIGARQTVCLTWSDRRFVLKHYVEPSWRHAAKRLVLPSRAAMTWTTSHRLADAGMLTPRPAACVENRLGPMRRDSFLIYPYVEGQPLRSFFDGRIATDPVLRERLWKQYCQFWRQFEQLQVSPGDANLANFIVTPNGRMWVIDLDKTRFHRLSYLAEWHRRRRWRQVMRCVAQCEEEREERLSDNSLLAVAA